MRPRSFFKYVIASFVQLAQGTPPMQRVIWRDKQVVLSITGRQPYEVPVYRLDNDHWDCYYEHELHPALLRDNRAA
jgi:hypothetical protein